MTSPLSGRRLLNLPYTHFCYDGESPTYKDKKTRKKQHIYSIKKNIKISNKLTQMCQRTWEKRQALQRYSQILLKKGTVEMPAIKIALKEIYKREDKI